MIQPVIHHSTIIYLGFNGRFEFSRLLGEREKSRDLLKFHMFSSIYMLRRRINIIRLEVKIVVKVKR